MRLPDFLVIGAQRAGTTWLDTQLRVHPEIYLPQRRKEIHFFDQYYDRGLEWYQEFFPPIQKASQYRRIGEITPKYLYDPAVPARIHRHLPHCLLIAVLRHPVDRAYSQYALSVQQYGDRRDFLNYIHQEPDVFARGLYSEQIKRYLQLFPVENLLILIFERLHRDTVQAFRQLSDFLEISSKGFSMQNDTRKIGTSYRVRFARSYAFVRRVGSVLRSYDVDWAVNAAKKLGAPKLFGHAGRLPPLDSQIRTRLQARYEADICALEVLLGDDLSDWRQPNA